MPDHEDVRLQEANLSQIVPTEYHADLVVLLSAGRPVYGIVVEIQLGRDEDKRFSRPLYAVTLRARFRCPCCVLVVTPDAGVARWAARSIDLGQPRSRFTPLVLGPGAIPKITDREQARASPELAFLSVQAHIDSEEGPRVAIAAKAAIAAVHGVVHGIGMLYADLIELAITEAVRQQMEELMRVEDYKCQSAFAQKHHAEGLAEGLAEGQTKGKAHALLMILETRGLPLSPEQQRQILQCTETTTLDHWIERSLHVETADELLH